MQVFIDYDECFLVVCSSEGLEMARLVDWQRTTVVTPLDLV